MKNYRTLMKRSYAFVMAAIVTVCMLLPASVLVADEAWAATTYSFSNYYPYSDYIRFKCNGMTGTCIQPANHNTGEGRATLTKLSNNSKLARIAYYYGAVKKWDTSKNYAYWLKTMLQITNEPGKAQTVISDAKISKAKGYINRIPSDLKVPDNFVIYKGDPTNGQQDFVVWKLTPVGYAKLVKSSSDARSSKVGGYDFSGIEYTVYKSDKKTVAGKLTCTAGGTTNTLSLAEGTYYVKETKTNSSFTLNAGWITCSVKSGKTTTLKASDSPVTVPVTIEKSIEGGTLDPGEKITFRLVNTSNSSVSYTVEMTGNEVDAVSKTVNMLAGKYTVTEVLPADSPFIDETGAQTVTVQKGKPLTIKRKNFKVTTKSVQVRKSTDDGGSAEGFTFRITGLLDNSGTLTEADFLETAGIQDGSGWSADSGDLNALNQAAADHRSGDYIVRVTGTVPPVSAETPAGPPAPEPEEETEETDPEPAPDSGQDPEPAPDSGQETGPVPEPEPAAPAEKERTVEVTVHLEGAVYDAGNETFKWPVDGEVPRTSEYEENGARYNVRYNDFTWHGAATAYTDLETGEDFTLLTTRADSYGYREGSSERGIDPAFPGTYTATEVMTDEQSERYHEPASAELHLGADDRLITFSFENAAKRTDVKLVKTSPDGEVGGITFKLTGKNVLGQDVEITASTDEDGRLDFGKLYGGYYVVEETSFDPDNYVNNHVLDGYDVPAVRVEVTGEEKEPVTIEFDNRPITRLYVTKVDTDSQEFLEDAEFDLLDGSGALAARFAIVQNDDGSAGIRMIETAGDIYGTCEKAFVDDDDDALVIDSGSDDDGGDGTGDDDQEGPSGSGGDDEEGDEGSGDVPVEYNYAVLYNLRPGEKYTLKETRAPGGYSMLAESEFTFEDTMKLKVENKKPEIATTARDKETGTHYGHADDSVSIVDTVEYKYLIPGKEYVMKATLVYKPDEEHSAEGRSAGEAEEVKAGGKPVTAIKSFVAGENGSGTVDVEFTSFDGRALRGRSVVVFEECMDFSLSARDQVVAAHIDTNDAGQTVIYPRPDYEMYKVRNEEATLQPETGKYGFQESDVVTYTVVIQNTGDTDLSMDVSDSFADHMEYFTTPVIESVTIEPADGEPVTTGPADGETVTTGPADGDPVTADEDAYSEFMGKNSMRLELARGATARIVYSAAVKPEAEQYLAAAAEDSDSEDDDGNDVNRRVRTNEPDESDGYRNVAMTTKVEYPNPENPGNPISYPEGDRDDDAQTPVRTPVIGTSLVDSEGNKTVKAREDTVLVDSISFSGLRAGETYVFEGTLMVKRTGKPVMADGEPVTGQSEPVTVDNEDGFAEVRFHLDTKALDGEEIVAFEKAYRLADTGETVLVAEHDDIDNLSQTVGINRPVNTGDVRGTSARLYTIVLFGSMGSLAALLGQKHHKKERRQ